MHNFLHSFPIAHVWSSTSTSCSPEKKHKILSPFLAEKCTIVQCNLDVMFTLIILCCDHCLDQLISAMFLHGIYWIKLPAPQDKKLGEHWVEKPNNWTRSDKFQKEPSNICLFYLGLIAVMHSKENNNNTLKSYLLSNWKVFHLNFCRRYLHFAFQHWSKQNRLSNNLVKSLISHIDSEHNKVQFCWYLNYCSGFCFKRCCINFVMSWV